MEQLGKIIMKYSSNPGFDALLLFEITLFSFLTGNADMHLKNFSLIDYENGLTQLALAYDLLSTRLVIPEKDDPEELALTMNAKKRKFRKDDFEKFAQSLGLIDKQVDNVFKNFQKALPKALSLVDVSFLKDEMKLGYRQLITERAKRVLES